MASIALTIIGRIGYLAIGAIFTRAMFRPKIKGEVFFPAKNPIDELWEVVRGQTLGPLQILRVQSEGGLGDRSCETFEVHRQKRKGERSRLA